MTRDQNQRTVINIYRMFMALDMSLSMGMGTYYAKYILGDENMAGFFAAVSILPVIVCMPAVVPLSKKYGKRNVALLGSLISLAGQTAAITQRKEM